MLASDERLTELALRNPAQLFLIRRHDLLPAQTTATPMPRDGSFDTTARADNNIDELLARILRLQLGQSLRVILQARLVDRIVHVVLGSELLGRLLT